MATVSKPTADDIIAGKFSDSNVVKIVEYTTPEGGTGYGLIHRGEDLDKYEASPYIIKPRLYWEKK